MAEEGATDPHVTFAKRYARMVLARLSKCTAAGSDLPPEAQALAKTVATDAPDDADEAVIWDHIHAVETCELRAQSDEAVLRERIALLLGEHEQLVGAERQAKLLGRMPPDPGDGKVGVTGGLEWARTRALTLLDEVAYQYRAAWACQEIRSEIRRRLFAVGWPIAVGATVVATTFVFFPALRDFPLSLLRTVLLVGAIGAVGSVTSVLNRQPDLSWNGNADLEMMVSEDGSTGVRFRPTIGAVFAIVFYAIMAGGLLRGALFPFAAPSPGGAPAPWDDIAAPGLVDSAKILVWSFIAGFAERFVPSQLDRLIESASTRK